MFPSAFSLLKRSKDDDDPKPSYLGYVWMNLKVVEEDLIGAQSSQESLAFKVWLSCGRPAGQARPARLDLAAQELQKFSLPPWN